MVMMVKGATKDKKKNSTSAIYIYIYTLGARACPHLCPLQLRAPRHSPEIPNVHT
eukprot:COSAG05_NODE_22526_length_264_cov_0.630303_1_plen_54_part_10